MQILSGGILANGVLENLNISDNNLGRLVVPGSWEKEMDGKEKGFYRFEGGSWTLDVPKCAWHEGAIALAIAIQQKGTAITALDISDNHLPGSCVTTIWTICDTNGIPLKI